MFGEFVPAPDPEDLTATVEDYENAPSDYRVETDGVRKVVKRSTRGAVLVTVEADR